jgi:hypothetical protein
VLFDAEVTLSVREKPVKVGQDGRFLIQHADPERRGGQLFFTLADPERRNGQSFFTLADPERRNGQLFFTLADPERRNGQSSNQQALSRREEPLHVLGTTQSGRRGVLASWRLGGSLLVRSRTERLRSPRR